MPLLGFRTTSHASSIIRRAIRWLILERLWRIRFWHTPGAGAAFGHTHYGHKSTTDVSIIDAPKSDHPILQGVNKNFLTSPPGFTTCCPITRRLPPRRC